MDNKTEIIKDIVILYHAECPDGFGAAWAAWKKFGNSADYIPVDNHESLPASLKNKQIFFIDIIPDEAALKKVINENDSVIGIDHHKTNEPKMSLFKEYSFDNNHSGAVLAWKYFHPDKLVPKLLLFIEDVDIWKLEYPETENFISALNLYDFSFELFDKVASDIEDPVKLKDYLLKGEIISRYNKKIIDQLSQIAVLVEFEGYKVYAANAPDFIGGQVANNLAKSFPPFTFTWRQEKERIHVSLRSLGDFDVTGIAKKYGGGGHKHAAGFNFPAGQPFPWKIIKESS